MQRRCGWLTHGEETKGPPIWARNDVVLFTCPKSYVTSESETLVEEFFVRRRMGAIARGLIEANRGSVARLLELIEPLPAAASP